jgi:hypothetical protein
VSDPTTRKATSALRIAHCQDRPLQRAEDLYLGKCFIRTACIVTIKKYLCDCTRATTAAVDVGHYPQASGE